MERMGTRALAGYFGVLVMALAGGVGCGGDGGRACVPGETASCLCASGASGVQSCNSSGSGFSTCFCESGGGDGGMPGVDGGPPPPPPSCSAANCAGCCSGTTCLGGNSVSACGTGGTMCLDCGPSRLCNGGACVVDPASRWNVFVLDLEMSSTKLTGEAWDAFGGAPDPYVVIGAGAGGARQTFRTATVQDARAGGLGYQATFNQQLSNVRADAIKSELRFDVFDEDVSSDDFVGACVYRGLADGAFGTGPQTLNCERDAASQNAGFRLRWELRRN